MPEHAVLKGGKFMDKTKYDKQVQEWMCTVQDNCETDMDLTLGYCNKIIRYGKEIEDNALIAFGYYFCGVVYYVMNDGTHFYDAVTSALSYLSKAEEWELMARCYNFLGISSVSRGNAAIALEYYLTATQYCKKAKSDYFASVLQINIGMLNVFCGRYHDALESFEVAYDYFSRHKELRSYHDDMMCVYENMAKAYLLQGQLSQARSCFERIYKDHKDYADDEAMITVLCTEAMYYHIAGDDGACEKNIAEVHKKTSPTMPLMNMFDDYYDYCKVLIERGKEKEFWHIMEIMEPLVRSLGIIDLHRRLVALKLKSYRKNNRQDEYLKEAGLYFELSEMVEVENKTMMNNVLSLRRNLERVNREKKEIEAKNALLVKKSETDALTGLNNRFRLKDYSEDLFQKAIENKTSLAVEVLDMDGFKGYNDFYGHQKGDECIKQIASAVKSMEEFGAFTARYGGDEFILIYKDVTKEQMIDYATELRRRVMNLGIECFLSRVSDMVTISQGICCDIPIEGSYMWDFIEVADEMLYRVKQKKRNNFCISDLTKESQQIIMSYL